MESMASKKKTKQNKVKESEEGQSKQKVKVKGVSELDFLVQKQLRRKQRKTSISLGVITKLFMSKKIVAFCTCPNFDSHCIELL